MRLPVFLALAGLVLASPAIAAPVCDGANGYAASFDGRQTFLWRPEALALSKARIAKDPTLPAYVKLMKAADAAMTEGPWSVTDKTRMPPSGDRHDYMSIAPYFWPDPAKPDGLPYINRDGEINPERATEAFDRTRLGEMADAVQALALAYYFTGQQKYADRAALVLKTWFVDPKTRMKPNLDFAQGVPGKVSGRSYGIIDSAELLPVVESVGLLQPSRALSAGDVEALRNWFGDLTTWMTDSENGRTERAAANNHAIWYDLELSEFALFAGKTELARSVIAAFADRRIKPQFTAGGSLPQELKRTRSFHYSTWTLQATYDVAGLGECVGVDLWSWQDADGKGLKASTRFIATYAGHEKDWTWQEISMNTQDLYDALLRAAWGYRDPTVTSHVIAKSDARTTLVYPLLP
ncbi:alginate lyase family protein [Asticcacaulis solisilvae]|uniref:alginate lyase family protein n=1 Tax=Asticcacaulis solisilvae TaxID=1217274 RepID=UPI003FD8BF57